MEKSNKHITSRIKRLAAAAALGLLATSTTANAAMIIDFAESGSDVVATMYGSANTTDLTLHSPNLEFPASGVSAKDASLFLGGPGRYSDMWIWLDGPFSFGTGGYLAATSATGDTFGLSGGEGVVLFLPTGYTSGDALNSSLTFNNQTFASIGLTSGSYDWTWGSGANADSLTLNIPSTPTAVPVPAAAWLMGSGLLGIAGWKRRQKRAAQV